MEFNFTLKYRLPDSSDDVAALEKSLVDAGCDDALLGSGRPGRLALAFCREAETGNAALLSALEDVQRALPGAELIEVGPDLVGLTDVADLLGMSRQNMRKLMMAHPQSFPSPVHDGSVSIWHLTDILGWLQARGSRKVTVEMTELAAAALKLNLARQCQQHP